MENREHLIDIVEGMKPGETTNIQGNEEKLSELCELHSLKLQHMGHDWFKISCPSKPSASKMGQIVSTLESYKTGNVAVPFEVGYVRQIVSKWNSSRKDCFKVGKTDEDTAVVYKNVEDRDFIRDSEYDAIKLNFNTRLMDLKTRIRPDAFFDGETEDDSENEDLI